MRFWKFPCVFGGCLVYSIGSSQIVLGTLSQPDEDYLAAEISFTSFSRLLRLVGRILKMGIFIA
jgi:hypothetical protein